MTTVSTDTLKDAVSRVLPRIQELRRRLHQEPELHLQEHKTRARIAEALSGTSLRIWDKLMDTDLIGELPGKSDRTVLLRADIDALPIEEQSGVPHRSLVPGMMHACGHDGHTAIMIGTALVLDELKEHLPVTVRFVFQPGEELVAGGKELVARGACEGAEAAYALHGGPGRPVGTVSTLPGPFLAASSFFTMIFTGKGGHAAMPELAANPIPVAAQWVNKIAEMHAEINAADGSVATISSFKGGESGNAIPDKVKLLGTMRYLRAGFGDELKARIQGYADDVCQDTGVSWELDCREVYSLPVLNDDQAVGYIRQVLDSHLGPGVFRDEPKPVMAAEDFAFYLKDRPGAMFWLGLGEEQPSLHNPAFDFNDDALENGILTFCLIALNHP